MTAASEPSFPSPDDHASRRAAARVLLTRAQWVESLRIASVPTWRIALWSGFQAALSLCLAAVVLYLSPWDEWVGYAGLGALISLFGRFYARADRRQELLVCTALMVMGVALPSLALWLWNAPWVMISGVGAVAGIAAITMHYRQIGAPGAVIVVFAAGAAMVPAASIGEVLARIAVTAFGSVVAGLVCVLTDAPRVRMLRFARVPRSTSAITWSEAGRMGIRIAVAAMVAAAVSLAWGAHHFVWAAIGAVAVVQSAQMHLQMNRALQRTVGTILGALLAWGLLAMDPGFWMLLLSIVLLQFLTEALIGYNYAIGQTLVTPMALLMTYLGMPGDGASMALERVLDTMTGALCGMVLSVIFSSVQDRVTLMQHQRSRLR